MDNENTLNTPKPETTGTSKAVPSSVRPNPTVKKAKPRRRSAKKGKPSLPDGTVLWETAIDVSDKELIENTLKEIEEETGMKLNEVTLLKELVNENAIRAAKDKVKEKLKAYEDLLKKQKELGIHLLG